MPTIKLPPMSRLNDRLQKTSDLPTEVDIARVTVPSVDATSIDVSREVSVVLDASTAAPFCNFCGDLLGGRIHQCKRCNAQMCEQAVRGGPGCVQFRTADAAKAFHCPHCWRLTCRQTNQRSALPYGFTGYGHRVHSRLTWPTILICAKLRNDQDTHIADCLELNSQALFYERPEFLYTRRIELKYTTKSVAEKAVAPARAFLEKSMLDGSPANTFIVFDTHSEDLTGHLQYSSNPGKRNHASIRDLIDQFVGQKLLDRMSNAARVARQSVPDSEHVWYKKSTHWRGGWRVLVLCTCGPAMRVESHFEVVQDLVEQDLFDVVIGFGGSSTLPIQVASVISRMFEGLGVNKTAGIWDTVCNVVLKNSQMLDSNSLVVVCKERSGSSSTLISREIGLHHPPARAWGCEFMTCATEACRSKTQDLDIRSNARGIRLECMRCSWRSAWISEDDVKGLVTRVHPRNPSIFWHVYPVPSALLGIFTSPQAKASEPPHKKRRVQVGHSC